MNGTWKNWAAHAALGIVIAALFGLAFTPTAGFAVSAAYWIAKEAGEFSVKHWDAPGRPWADFNPFDKRRTADDRFDLFSGLFGAAVGAAVLAGVGA